MKSYLDTLKRNELIKLYNRFGLDNSLKSKLLTFKNTALKELILKENVLDIETAKSALLKTNDSKTKETEHVVKGIQEYNNQPVVENLPETKDPIIIKNTAQVSEANKVRELADKLMKRALEPLIVTIQTVHDRDIEAKKKSDTIFFSNQYFSVAKVVPFGIKCELPRCIVEIAKEALAPTYIKYESFEEQRKAGTLGNYVMRPKYSVVIHGRKEDLIKSAQLEAELGIY